MTVPISHLDEAFRLAQLIARDQDAAALLVFRAYESAGEARSSRFAVLRAVVAASGVGPTGPNVDEAGPEGFAPTVPAEAPTPAVPPSDLALVDHMAGRAVRDRVLPSAFAALAPADRIALWLDASGLSSPADAGTVLGVSAPEALASLAIARRRIEVELLRDLADREARLVSRVVRSEPVPDALRRVLDPLFDPVPSSLRDRLQPAPTSPAAGSKPRRLRPRWGGVARIAAFIGAAAVVGYAVQSFRPAPPPSNPRADLVETVLDVAPDTDLAFRTSSAEQAEVFIRDRVGWRVVVPEVQGSVLEGVGVTQFGPGGDVPVLHFDGARPVVMVVVTYAYLDRVAPRLSLPAAVLQQIADDGRFSVLDAGPKRATTFRHQDDIFIAVTRSDVTDLDQSVLFPR